MTAIALTLHSVAIAYAQTEVVHDVSLELAAGELHALLGSSGSGKTTLLRAIAGFAPIVRGRIELFGAVVDDGTRWTPPEKRGVGVVFQDFALFPHLNVADNVGFARTKAGGSARVAELLARVGLPGYGARHVSDLSGGEQQRVALARALAQEPRMILFDEPFSNLNRELRRSLRAATATLLREQGIAALFVTHDPEEAFALADRVSVLHRGRLLQTDTPRALYETPRTRMVAQSVGDVVIVRANMLTERAVSCALGQVAVHGAKPSTTHVLLRPEQLQLRQGTGAAVVTRRYAGALEEVDLQLEGGETITARIPAGALPADTQHVALEIQGLGVALDE